MTTTTYYNLNIVEGTDIVNPLIVDNPNYEKIDETMHNNAVAGVTIATEIANATVHAITRENSDCAVIRFIATSRWKAGDTATVDGVPVTALLPSGETLPDGAYVINANVLCILTGTNLTVYVGGKKLENASDVIYKDTNVGAELDKLNGSVEQLNGNVTQINSNLNEMQNNIFDAPINIVEYTTTSYICPSDGYIKALPNGNIGDYIIVYINDVMLGTYRCISNGSPTGSSIYVRKGMKVKLAYNIEPTAEFIPIK